MLRTRVLVYITCVCHKRKLTGLRLFQNYSLYAHNIFWCFTRSPLSENVMLCTLRIMIYTAKPTTSTTPGRYGHYYYISLWCSPPCHRMSGVHLYHAFPGKYCARRTEYAWAEYLFSRIIKTTCLGEFLIISLKRVSNNVFERVR